MRRRLRLKVARAEACELLFRPDESDRVSIGRERWLAAIDAFAAADVDRRSFAFSEKHVVPFHGRGEAVARPRQRVKFCPAIHAFPTAEMVEQLAIFGG